MKEPKDAPPMVAAPRHLRRRILHSEVPDTLLVPGADPLPLESAHVAKPQSGIVSSRVQAYGRKRAVALLAVIIVSVSILALLLTLILTG